MRITKREKSNSHVLAAASVGKINLVILAVLVVIGSHLGVLLPRQLSAMDAAHLRETIATARPSLTQLRATYEGRARLEYLNAAQETLVAGLCPLLAGVTELGSRTAVSDVHSATGLDREPLLPPCVGDPTGCPFRVRVLSHDRLSEMTTWQTGRAPGSAVAEITIAMGQVPQIEVGFLQSAAGELGIDVGAEILLLTQHSIFHPDTGVSGVVEVPLALKVTGLFTETPDTQDLWSPIWLQSRVFNRTGGGGDTIEVFAGAIAHGDVFDELVQLGPVVTRWWYDVDIVSVAVGDLPNLESAVLAATSAQLPPVPDPRSWGGVGQLRVTSDIPQVLSRYHNDIGTSRNLNSMVYLGVGVIAVATIAISAGLLAHRHREAVMLSRSRGLSLSQVWAIYLPAVIVVAAIASLIGVGAGIVISPSGDLRIPILFAGLVSVVAISAVATALAAQYRNAITAPGKSPRGFGSAHRVVLDCLVIALAVVAVVLVRQRGGAAGAVNEVDAYLALTPVLLALCGVVFAARFTPLTFAFLSRLAGANSGAATFVGLHSARRRRSAASALAMLVLVVATAFATFAVTLAGQVDQGQQIAAWQRVGADLVLTDLEADPESMQTTAALLRADARVQAVVPAVRGVAELRFGFEVPRQVDFIQVDPAQFAAARISNLSDGEIIELERLSVAATGNSALVSIESGIPEAMGTLTLAGGDQTTVLIIGTSSAVPQPVSPAVGTLLVPLSEGDLPAGLVNTMLVYAAGVSSSERDENARTLAAEFDSEAFVLTSRAHQLESLRQAPLTHGTRTLISIAILASAVLALLAVLMSLVADAPSRAVTCSILRTLGLKETSAHLLLVVEFVPLVLTAVLTGVVAGVGLPSVLGPAIDLTTYTGGIAATANGIDLRIIGGIFTGVVALVALAVGALLAVDRRRHTGEALRVGGIV